MVEKSESDQEESQTRDLSASKDNPKPDTAEILRRQGPEFERPKEDIVEKPQVASQGPGQTTVSPSTDPAGKTSDEAARQKKDAELAQKIEQLTQEEEALKNQKLAELRKQLQEIQQDKGSAAQPPKPEADQDEDYYQGMGQ